MKLKGNRNGLAVLAALALGVVFLGPGLQAQNEEQTQGQPARAVRLSYVDGQVSLAQGSQVLAEQAVANTPLFEGTQITTADNGKAEIQFEDGSVARISPDSSLTLKVLRGAGTSADAQLLLNGGLAYFEFQGGSQAGKMSVQFGGTMVTTSGFTVIRITLDNPPGKLAVFSGNAHLEVINGAGSSAASVDLHGGESIKLNGADPSSYDLAESIEPDSWDAWNSDRDQALTTEAAAQTGASSGVGANENPAWNDLDANGNWYDVPGQGYIWSPYEAASEGFDPYGNGNWMWSPGYGYLWISGYPWGYLPFQCGAWNFYNGFGWGWAPGFGGCQPWWGMGFYGGPNVGHGPHGYRVIPRPILPRHPINPRPVSMIAVNRSGPRVHFAPPVRDRNTPVTIGGNTVQPLRPLPSRPVFDHQTFAGGANRTQPGNQGAQPGSQGMPPAGGHMNNTRPGYIISRPTGPAPASGPSWQAPSTPSHVSPPPSTPPPGRSSWFGGSAGRSSGNGSSGGGSPHQGGGYSGGGSPHPSGGSSGGGSPSGGGGYHGGSSGGGGGGGGGGGYHGGGGSSGSSGGGGGSHGGGGGGGGGGHSGGGGGGGGHH